jgi:hypothetical protein
MPAAGCGSVQPSSVFLPDSLGLVTLDGCQIILLCREGMLPAIQLLFLSEELFLQLNGYRRYDRHI